MALIVDYAVLCFWNTLFQLNLILIKVVSRMLPFSVVKNRATGFIEACGVKMTNVFEGDEPKKYDKTKFSCELVIKDKRFYYKVFEATMGLGEGYMDGLFDCDNIPEFISRVSPRLKPKNYRKLYNKVQLARNRQGFQESHMVADAHYNLGNDLYQNMLDKEMQYTCALWYPETKTLEEAQINKLDLVGRKLKLKPGMKLLELGGGFGGAAKYMAKNFGCSVTVYNISKEQVKYGRENCKGLPVEFVLADYRTASGQFDRVYSIGLFEHIGHLNWRGYYEVVDRCLKPDGLALTHTIISSDENIEIRTDAWISKYIFANGELPNMRDLLIQAAPTFVTEDVQSFSKSYAKTLHEWDIRFKQSWNKIKDNYQDRYDGRFKRMWEWYLGICEGQFLCRHAQLAQVVHSKFGREEEYYSVRDQKF